jgi:hypothetical protein
MARRARVVIISSWIIIEDGCYDQRIYLKSKKARIDCYSR